MWRLALGLFLVVGSLFAGETLVDRPRPLLELGSPYLGTGDIPQGFEVPTGAVWQPWLMVYGTYRTALQTVEENDEAFTEWANRLDLHANLQFSGTERVLVSLRPLDQDNRFSGYAFNDLGGLEKGWQNEFNSDIQTLFFEGDFGELFPGLDPKDRHSSDWGFSVGRQPILFQEGLLIDDELDAVGIVRNNMFPVQGANLRHTLLYAWEEVHRADNHEDRDARLYALFSQLDSEPVTLEADAVYVDAEDRGFHWGVSAIGRAGLYNLTFRALGSQAIDEESLAVSSGSLLFAETSTTLPRSEDLVYANVFWGIDDFASAARGPDRGGPLARLGILYEAVGLGHYGAALGNQVGESAGGAIGIQHFFNHRRGHVILELGGRIPTTANNPDPASAALGLRLQQAYGRRTVMRWDSYGVVSEDHADGYGARMEMKVEF